MTADGLRPPAGTLAGVLPGVLAALGRPVGPDPLGLADELAGVQQVALLLVDGLGYHLLPAAARSASLFADVLAGTAGSVRELESSFPSTTPTSLVTLGTGRLPGVHGVLGFTVNVPGTERVLTHIVWRNDPSPRQWQPLPRLLERSSAIGIPSAVVAPAAFQGSGLTDAAYGAPHYVGRKPGAATASAMVAELRAGTRLVYGYHAGVDAAAHKDGIASAGWQDAVREAARLITAVADGLPPGAALLVTADHGGLDIAPENRIDIDRDPRLLDDVRVVAGEPRVRYLHVHDGAADAVRASWQAVLGERAGVYLRDEVIEAGMFGPMTDEHRARVGDVVVICTAPIALYATAHEPPETAELVAMHGALTAVETAVPLITFRR